MSQSPQTESKSASINRAKLEALSEVDRSLRFPAGFFMINAALWLVLANVITLVSSLQSYYPEFLSSLEWLTYGRLYPVATNALFFGWGCNAIFAVSLWLIARLSLSPVRDGGLLMIAGVFWNLGLTIGLLGVIAGDTTAAEFLELPGYSTPILLIAYTLIGAWGVLAFNSRKEKAVGVSQWYIIGALFCFPWIYTIAQFMVVWFPARGVVQPIIGSWFLGSFMNLWFTPVALAVAYYIIPKILGRPIYSHALALFGFCSLLLVGSWTGLARLTGGPIPVWLSSISIVALVVMIIPMITVVINLFFTVKDVFAGMWRSLALRFILFGMIAYLIFGIASAVLAFHSLNEIVQFTAIVPGQTWLLFYAFFSMVVFGGLYFMAPRLSGREWPSTDLIHLHFWGSSVGIMILVLSMFLSGWISGTQMNVADVVFIEIVQSTVIWSKVSVIGFICLLVGNVSFLINFLGMLVAGHRVNSKEGAALLESGHQQTSAS